MENEKFCQACPSVLAREHSRADIVVLYAKPQPEEFLAQGLGSNITIPGITLDVLQELGTSAVGLQDCAGGGTMTPEVACSLLCQPEGPACTPLLQTAYSGHDIWNNWPSA